MIGAPTGRASGVFVLDIDMKDDKNGCAELPDWETRSPLIVKTASGGYHVYFRADDQLRNTQSKISAGLDTRGEGG